MSLLQIAYNNKKLSSATGLVLLLVHLFITITYSFFLHTHTLENGKKVVHSHPFQTPENGESQHRHSASTFQLLPDLNQYNDNKSIIVISAFENHIDFYSRINSFSAQIIKDNNLRRGPPNISFIFS